MKFMIMCKIPPAHYTTAVKPFLKSGAPAPKGLKKTIGRWHTAGSSKCLHFVEAPRRRSRRLMPSGPISWNWEVVPVVEDDVAGAVSKKLYG